MVDSICSPLKAIEQPLSGPADVSAAESLNSGFQEPRCVPADFAVRLNLLKRFSHGPKIATGFDRNCICDQSLRCVAISQTLCCCTHKNFCT